MLVRVHEYVEVHLEARHSYQESSYIALHFVFRDTIWISAIKWEWLANKLQGSPALGLQINIVPFILQGFELMSSMLMLKAIYEPFFQTLCT